MEDEQGSVGPGSCVGVSESALSVHLPSESPAENMGGEDRVERSYEEGDGGEIMVEIVGSDVFVDGVSGDTKGDLGSEEVKDLEGNALENKEGIVAMDISSEIDGNKMEESTEEPNNAVKENVEMDLGGSGHVEVSAVSGLSPKADGVSDNDLRNPGVEAVAVSSAAMEGPISEQVEAVEGTPMVISEEKVIRDEAVDKINADDHVKAVIPSETVVEGIVSTAEKEESVAISEENAIKDEEVDKDDNLVKSEVVNKDGVSEKQEMVPPNDAVDNNVADSVVAEVGLVNTAEEGGGGGGGGGGEILESNCPKDEIFNANKENLITDGDIGQKTEPVDEKKVLAAESGDSVLKTVDSVSDVQEENQVDGMKCEAAVGVHDASHGIDVKLSDTTDFKDEALVFIDQDHAPSNESTQLAEIETHTEGNQPIKTAAEDEVSNDEKIAISQLKVVDEDLSTEKGEPEISVQSGLENAEIPFVDASTESIHLSSEDHAVLNDPIINAEVGIDNVIEAPQREEQMDTTQITETPNQLVDNPDNINSFADVSVINEVSMPEKEELLASDVATSIDEVSKTEEAEYNSRKNNGFHKEEGQISEKKAMDVEEERESDRDYHGGIEEPASETENFKLLSEETINSATTLRMNQLGYLLPPENEGHFSRSDLVWGKVRSHPWWPGQIFDPSEASEKAVKYYKKDSYLVAYFGDRTFAWNDASVLKPFRSYFSQIEKQSTSEAFQNAVNSALEEVSRRVELGLACSCIPKDSYSKIEAQVVENAGIREECSLRQGVDNSSKASNFEPEKLLEYITNLAPRAFSGADRLDLVIAKAQLSAFCSFKGYPPPSEFPSSGELLEIDEDTEQLSDEMIAFASHEGKDGDGEYFPDAEEDSVSLSSGRKRKAVESLQDGLDKRANIIPKPSFKIGECIRRVASQLTGPKDETIVSGSPKTEEHPGRKSVAFSAESFSVDEMLSHLQIVANDPKKSHGFYNNIHNFFMGFRSSIALNKRGRKKKAEPTVGGFGEEFEFDDVNDSYWTDRIVQNYSEEQLLQNTESTPEINHHIVASDAEKTVKSGRKPHSRKRYSTGNYPTESMDVDESVKRRKQESSPAELILNFSERNSVPSEINLNKIFRRFGPLMESETEVDHEMGRAKVIFKRGADAEVAHNSAEKFNIFGPVLVNYEIGYSPVISVKISPLALPQFPEDASLMI